MSAATEPVRRCADCGTQLGELQTARDGTVVCLACYCRRHPPLKVVEAGEAQDANSGGGPRSGGCVKFATRSVDLDRMRPVAFAWRPWIVRGGLNLMVGEEGVGKSTLQMWIAAQMTRGKLPGAFDGQPVRVLFIGADEDDWDTVVVPRLHAADADFDQVDEFYAVDHSVFNIVDHVAELERVLRARPYGLVLVEHLMDVLPPMRNYTDPAAMRAVLKPFARLLARTDVAGLGTLHVNKADAASFRQKQQGTMQFGARSRSSFLVDRHPKDPAHRVAILGKANYVRSDEPTAVGFKVESCPFFHNGHLFDVGRVVDVEADDSTMEAVLARGPSDRDRKKQEQRILVTGALSEEPQSVRAVARAAGIPKSTVQRILEELEDDGLAERTDVGWIASDDDDLQDPA